MDAIEARATLETWRRAFPEDPYREEGHLRRWNRRALDPKRAAELDRAAAAFGRRVVTEVGPAAERYEHRAHLPELVGRDWLGRPTEEIHFDPDYHRAGRAVWESGVVAYVGTPGRAFEQATLLYLLSLEGEAGHACPVVCSIGLARALRRKAGPAVRDRFLPALLERDYERAERGSQFLTEIQGGSDVGANACTAAAREDGSYEISGEKWFCSVADAGQFLVTARPAGARAGTAGLGCFIVPRTVGGQPNGFRVRRLKEKLGTRGLATGEIEFDGALGWPVGPLEEGFKIAAGVVLNTSRWLTSVGSAGMMRRAYLEASRFARLRCAFGRPIGEFPAVRTTLARIKTRWLGALHATWLLTDLEDQIDADTASDESVALHRFLVNATKFQVSSAATGVVRDAIEVLGGNGTIEDFSVLPRLYRDAIVYESWEGTHDVLVAQVLADTRELGLASVVDSRLRDLLESVSEPAAKSAVETTLAALDGATALVLRAVDDASFGATHFRACLGQVMRVVEVATLLYMADDNGQDSEELLAAADLAVRLGLDRDYRPEADPGFLDRVDAVLGSEAPSP
jgi:acyl-CoA dehydrogenase